MSKLHFNQHDEAVRISADRWRCTNGSFLSAIRLCAVKGCPFRPVFRFGITTLCTRFRKFLWAAMQKPITSLIPPRTWWPLIVSNSFKLPPIVTYSHSITLVFKFVIIILKYNIILKVTFYSFNIYLCMIFDIKIKFDIKI